MLPRQELERDQRRAAAGGALVLEPAAEQLGLLPKAELADGPVRDGSLTVVVGAGRGLELVRPLRAEPRKLAFGAFPRELVRLRGG